MTKLVVRLASEGIVSRNHLKEEILASIEDIYNVSDMAELVDLSPLQLQRKLKRSTGLAPPTQVCFFGNVPVDCKVGISAVCETILFPHNTLNIILSRRLRIP